MEFKILVPTVTYGNVECRFNLDKIDNGKTAQENIDDAVAKVNYLAKKMKEGG